MTHIQLYTKINNLPSDLKAEVNDFIDFLLSRKKKKPLGSSGKSPQFGCAKGKIWVSTDFDEPLDEFKPYM